MPANLFEASKANAPKFDAALAEVLKGIPRSFERHIHAFSRWSDREVRLSINAGLFAIVALLHGLEYQNAHARAQELSGLSGIPADDLLRGNTGKFYARRSAFDAAFEDGRKFFYAALNGGGLGTVAYAPYCLVLTANFEQGTEKIAYWKGDSLVICTDQNGDFEPSTLLDVACPKSHRSHLLTIDCFNDITGAPGQEWSKLILSGNKYFEVAFVAPLTLDGIEAVRVGSDDYNRLWRMAFVTQGKHAGDAEKSLIADFLDVLRAHRDGRLKLEVVS